MIDQVTPLVLTYNEAANIGRTLGQLRWAREVLVVDSVSTDETVSIARSFPNVRVMPRQFDRFADQWNFGLEQVTSDWVLALDADYFVPEELVREIDALRPEEENGFRVRVIYAVFGTPLRGSLYPPATILFRRSAARFLQDGHTQRVDVLGEVGSLATPITHDDRKSLERWLWNQAGYAEVECRKLLSSHPASLSFADKVRRLRFLAPFAVFAYVLLGKGALLDGRPGFHYALQRLVAECILAMRLLEEDVLPRRHLSADS